MSHQAEIMKYIFELDKTNSNCDHVSALLQIKKKIQAFGNGGGICCWGNFSMSGTILNMVHGAKGVLDVKFWNK